MLLQSLCLNVEVISTRFQLTVQMATWTVLESNFNIIMIIIHQICLTRLPISKEKYKYIVFFQRSFLLFFFFVRMFQMLNCNRDSQPAAQAFQKQAREGNEIASECKNSPPPPPLRSLSSHFFPIFWSSPGAFLFDLSAWKWKGNGCYASYVTVKPSQLLSKVGI